MENQLYKIGDISRILGVSISKLYKLTEQGEIGCIKIGTSLRYNDKIISEYLERCKHETGTLKPKTKQQKKNRRQ